jgi:hypothetical protein
LTLPIPPALLLLTAIIASVPLASARTTSAPPKISQEALRTLDEARAMLAAGTLELRCLRYRPFEGSDSCETLIGRFASLEKSQPAFAATFTCVPAVCRTVGVGYRRDSASSITILITLKPIEGDPSGPFRIAEIEIGEGADTSD